MRKMIGNEHSRMPVTTTTTTAVPPVRSSLVPSSTATAAAPPTTSAPIRTTNKMNAHPSVHLLTMDKLRGLTDLEEIKRQLQLVEEQELQLERTIDTLLDQGRADMDQELAQLDSVRPQLQELQRTASSAFQVIAKTASLAEKMSTKVKALDAEQSKVKLAIQQVEDAQQLKNCITGVQQAMQVHDYETASIHIAGYLAFDPQLISTLLNDTIISLDDDEQTSKTVADASRIMDTAKHQLLAICNQRFQAAAEKQDEAVIFQFWKLFPRLGESELGLEKLCVYLSASFIRKKFQIALDIGEPRGVPFVSALTQLFEMLARVVDAEEEPVRTHYGPGRMLYLLRFVQSEADFHAIKVLDAFVEKRALQRKLKDIQTVSRAVAATAASEEAVKVDLREVGGVLEELASISQCIHVFHRFLSIRGQVYRKELEAVAVKDPLVQRLLSSDSNYKYASTTGILKVSELSARLQELMSSSYIHLESFFLVQSVRKALRIDSFDPDVDDLTSSCVDDSFFIFKQVVLRSMQSHDTEIICVVLNLVTRAVELDYLRDGLQKRLLTSFGDEKGSALADKSDLKVGYMILLNDLDKSMDYVGKLCNEADSEISKLSQDDRSREKIQSCLSQFQETTQQFKKLLRTCVEVLFSQTMRPRLRTLFGELFHHLKYVLTEEEYAQSELIGGMPIAASSAVLANLTEKALSNAATGKEGFVQRFTSSLEKWLMDGYRQYLTPANFSAFLVLCVDYFVKEWERHILFTSHSRFNALGALRFDKDLRSICSFLNQLVAVGTVRDRFTRLTQIALLVNMEQAAEIREYYGGEMTEIQWRLTATDIRKALVLRFGNEEVARIKL